MRAGVLGAHLGGVPAMAAGDRCSAAEAKHGSNDVDAGVRHRRVSGDRRPVVCKQCAAGHHRRDGRAGGAAARRVFRLGRAIQGRLQRLLVERRDACDGRPRARRGRQEQRLVAVHRQRDHRAHRRHGHLRGPADLLPARAHLHHLHLAHGRRHGHPADRAARRRGHARRPPEAARHGGRAHVLRRHGPAGVRIPKHECGRARGLDRAKLRQHRRLPEGRRACVGCCLPGRRVGWLLPDARGAVLTFRRQRSERAWRGARGSPLPCCRVGRILPDARGTELCYAAAVRSRGT
mmetsp:Transcript_20190/g.59954  ORF Transcript_20190/g.59954 Transcript_20190/m.59954 type:complete len:292 (+) Transcript_20190:1173-2048(+)